MPLDGWRWDHVIHSSLTQRSPAADWPRASLLKQLMALPIARRVMRLQLKNSSISVQGK